MTGGAVLLAGTTSDAGKTLLVAGLCRLLARRGVTVAPYKAQNMSLNSAVASAPDGGWGEVGRAQALQALAAGVPVETAMNPVLLKPSGERTAHVVLDGRPWAEADAVGYGDLTDRLRPHTLAALADLRDRFDVVICEGAGGIAEPNLRQRDLANAGLAAHADLPVVVVADIERGGVFASLYGSWALLDAADRARIGGFIINRFRGDPALLEPAIADLQARTGVPVLGVVPWLGHLRLEAEDSLGLIGLSGGAPPAGEGLRVAVARLPHLSNFTDLDAIGAEPGVSVTFTADPVALAAADLAVLPGTRATAADLAWLRARHLDRVVHDRVAAGRPVLGICGGYQALGRTITDDVEGHVGTVAGLGLLPVETTFATDKVVRPRRGHAPGLGVPAPEAAGYEIRHGLTTADAGATSAIVGRDGTVGGVVHGPVLGTSWHGLAEHDQARRALLRWAADLAGRDLVLADTSWAAVRLAALDVVADAVDAHLDVDAILSLATTTPSRSAP